MSGAEVIALSVLIFLFIINIIYYSKCKNKFKSFLLSVGSGILTLIPSALILSFFGYGASINIFSVSVSALLGMPGVALLITTAVL